MFILIDSQPKKSCFVVVVVVVKVVVVLILGLDVVVVVIVVIVTAPTQPQLNSRVGFGNKMTLDHHHHPPTHPHWEFNASNISPCS